MNPLPWQKLLWDAGLVVYAVASVELYRQQRYRRWPSFLAYCLVTLTGSLLLRFEIGHYATYFWVFWWREALRAALRLWMLYDLLRSIPYVRQLPRPLAYLTLAAALSMAAAATVMTVFGGSHTPSQRPAAQLLHLVLTLNRAVYTAWGSAMLAVLTGLAASGFGVLLETVRMGTGKVALLIGGLLSSLIFSSHALPAVKLATNVAADCLELSVFAYWIYSLNRHDGRTRWTADEERHLHHALETESLGSEDLQRLLEKDGTT